MAIKVDGQVSENHELRKHRRKAIIKKYEIKHNQPEIDLAHQSQYPDK